MASTPPDPFAEHPAVDLTKRGGDPDPAADESFDPYRFGRPEHPVPPEFAPPGYRPDIPSGAPYGPPPNPYGPPPGSPPGAPQYPTQRGLPGPPPYGGPPGYPSSPPAGYGQPPYGQSPYGGYPQPKTGSGKGTAALVLGILSVLLCWLSVFDALFIVPAIIFGMLGIGDAKRRNGAGRGAATAGVVCALVGAVLATIFSIRVFSAISDCGGLQHTTTNSQFQQCVQDHVS